MDTNKTLVIQRSNKILPWLRRQDPTHSTTERSSNVLIFNHICSDLHLFIADLAASIHMNKILKNWTIWSCMCQNIRMRTYPRGILGLTRFHGEWGEWGGCDQDPAENVWVAREESSPFVSSPWVFLARLKMRAQELGSVYWGKSWRMMLGLRTQEEST